MTRALQAGIATGLLTAVLATPTADASSCFEIFLAADDSKSQKTLSVTILVEGMMKSKSGAT